MKGPKTKIAPRPRGRPRSEQARQEILETAYNLLRDKGFDAVGSHEIAQAAGVSSATFSSILPRATGRPLIRNSRKFFWDAAHSKGIVHRDIKPANRHCFLGVRLRPVRPS
jgi:serine/threonine protein kinase